MTSLNRLIGLQAICQGQKCGWVERGVLDEGGEFLSGFVIRKGLGGAKWIPFDRIEALGGVSVVFRGGLEKLPKTPETRLGPVWEPSGLRLGTVTDVYLHTRTGRVAAIEISLGPVDDWRFGRMAAVDYAIRREKTGCKVLTPLAGLLPLTALNLEGEEDAHELG